MLSCNWESSDFINEDHQRIVTFKITANRLQKLTKALNIDKMVTLHEERVNGASFGASMIVGNDLSTDESVLLIEKKCIVINKF